ncbi:acyl-CoA-like ligand-binding transcription factor [Leifsonia sp. 2MCAF36]|uniref:acyl-CoA-like ligand-binding transcription factor n=1 Tax=Leifsonia sp. 2MCAF36 TaxID=3232988 RepID=UPI003F9D1B35
MSSPTEKPARGLRERKKAQTRASVQSIALKLFRSQGYENTTIEQIITLAEISESTFFRYFPTKEDLIISDDFDPLLIETFTSLPPDIGVLDALRRSLRKTFDGLSAEEKAEHSERIALVVSVPTLRAAAMAQIAETMTTFSVAIAERSGRDSNDFEIRVLAGAIVGAAMAMMSAVADDPTADPIGLMDAAMAQLETGLDLK